jgi:hypothetical protein
MNCDILQGVRSMYNDGLALSDEGQQAFENLAAFWHSFQGNADGKVVAQARQSLSDLAASVVLPGIVVQGQAVQVHFQLPPGYPRAAAHLRVTCAGPRWAALAMCAGVRVFTTSLDTCAARGRHLLAPTK